MYTLTELEIKETKVRNLIFRSAGPPAWYFFQIEIKIFPQKYTIKSLLEAKI